MPRRVLNMRLLLALVVARAAEPENTPALLALVSSAENFDRCALRRGAVPSGVAAEPLMRAAEALMPAFDAYGSFFGHVARKDLLGNVRKLERLGATDASDVGRLPLADADITHPDSAARALFWTNRIFQQIAGTFENLLDDGDASLYRCSLDAYEAVTAPYNSAAHRAIAKILFRIVPSRDAFVAIYGGAAFGDVAPTLRRWLDASAPARRSLDAYFDGRGWLKPPLRFGGEGACRTGAGDLCADVVDAPPPPRFAEAAWLATPALW